MTTGKLFLGMVVGATAGAAIGLMVAPKTGMETRKEIRGRTGTYSHAIRERFKKNQAPEHFEVQEAA